MSRPQSDETERGRTGRPVVVEVTAEDAGSSLVLDRLVADVRAQADAFIFLSGGASKMSEDSRQALLQLVSGCLVRLAETGLRFAVGDGGTKAGVMEAAGIARRSSGNAFPLVGVAPAVPVTATDEPGKTPIDPNHLAVVCVRNDGWAAARRAAGEPLGDYWGSEVPTMFELFARLADGRPSVALIANGGRVTLEEIRANLDAARPVVLIAGSKRAADAVIALLGDGVPADDEAKDLLARARALGLASTRELYHVFDLPEGPNALADTLAALLRPPGREAGP